MKCCGEERTTKFCAECGEMLANISLAGLLAHLQTGIKSRASLLATRERLAAEDPMHRNYRNRQVENCVAAIAKWQSWADELEKAIAALAEKEKRNETNQ